jgi:hypothetical protein
MTTATDIMNACNNSNEVMIKAESITDDIDQDWEHEATIYTFDDESVLVVSGGQANAFADRGSADDDLNA